MVGVCALPPAAAAVDDRTDLEPRPWLPPDDDRRRRSTTLWTAIYPAEYEALRAQTADVLITYDAPSERSSGFQAIDDLARALGVVRAFHGRHHDSPSVEYREAWEQLGFQPFAVPSSGVRNELGELISAVEAKRSP